MKWNMALKVSLFLILALSTVFSQTWKEDSLVVRQILDTNGLQTVPVDSVVKSIFEGRVNRLTFRDLPDFHSIPALIEKLTKLTELYFERTGLTIVPTEIGNLKTLQSLGFRSNKLSSLPPEIGNLTSLTSFGVSRDSTIKAIPPEIGKLCSLKTLSIMFTSITKLPDEVCNLKSLEWLSLHDNKLTGLPKDIGNLGSLSRLVDLSNNNLKSLPQSIVNLNVPPYQVIVCWNDSLVLTPEQCEWYHVKDYKDYIRKYCASPIEKTGEIKPVQPAARIQIGTRTVVLQSAQPGHVVCAVYDTKGIKIETLFSGNLSAQTHRITWDRTGYPSGVYYLRMMVGGNADAITSKVIIIK